MKYFTFMHLIVSRNALLLERKERKNQSILKIDFSNAINKIKLESRKESYSRGEDITQVYNIIYKLDFLNVRFGLQVLFFPFSAG